MLSIRRVPTVVSNYQEGFSLECEATDCGRDLLANCSLRALNLPLYAYKKDGGDDGSIENGKVFFSENLPPMSLLDDFLLGQWEDRMLRGLFRYNVTACGTKMLPGKHGFVVQLNEDRHLKKRPTEFWVDQVLQPFDENKFNFTKVGKEEVLFVFEPSKDNKSTLFEGYPAEYDPVSSNVVAINVSPIEYGHVLLIPHVLDRLPQRIDQDSFLVAVHFAKEAADPFFRVGYNSLGAFATINHLHFQAYYLLVALAVEKAQRSMIGKDVRGCGLTVSQFVNYPVRGFVFEGRNATRELSEAVADVCIWLQNNNIPFNILISDCGRRIFLFPQCYAEKQARRKVSEELLEMQVNPGVWEISGHVVIERRKDYEDSSEERTCRLLSEVSLSEQRFEEVKAFVFNAAGFTDVQLGGDCMNLEEGNAQISVPQHLAPGCMVVQ